MKLLKNGKKKDGRMEIPDETNSRKKQIYLAPVKSKI
jgi:hypothetical protein